MEPLNPNEFQQPNYDPDQMGFKRVDTAGVEELGWSGCFAGMLINQAAIRDISYTNKKGEQVTNEMLSLQLIYTHPKTGAMFQAWVKHNLSWDSGRERAAELHVPLTILDKKDITAVRQKDGVIDFSLSFRYDGRADFSIPAYALYQTENAALALAALKTMAEHSDSYDDLTAENAAAGLCAFHFQARMQSPEKDIWVDGANNPDGIRVLLDSFSIYAAGRRKVLLFAAMKDKDISAMVRHLCEKERWDRCFVTSASAGRGADPAVLAELFSQNGVSATVIPDPAAAYDCARKEMRGGVLLVCGSLYLAGSVLDR